MITHKDEVEIQGRLSVKTGDEAEDGCYLLTLSEHEHEREHEREHQQFI